MAKNAEECIYETLYSLKLFKEVILYLNDSTDNTKCIARKFTNVEVVEGKFLGFGPTKNKAAQYASNDWILSLDSDEVIPQRLLDEIITLNLDNNKNVYILQRENYFLGKKVKYSGWGKDLITRLYHKKYHSFNQNMVHEFVEIKDETNQIKLRNPFRHNAVYKVSQQIQKIDRYSEIYSHEKRCKKYSSPMVAVSKSIFRFLNSYIFKLGFLDGVAGLLIGVSEANGVFYKYMKLYEENKKCQ